MGETLHFIDPSFKREMKAWIKRNYTGIMLAEDIITVEHLKLSKN
jgi:hypothetical protein